MVRTFLVVSLHYFVQEQDFVKETSQVSIFCSLYPYLYLSSRLLLSQPHPDNKPITLKINAAQWYLRKKLPVNRARWVSDCRFIVFTNFFNMQSENPGLSALESHNNSKQVKNPWGGGGWLYPLQSYILSLFLGTLLAEPHPSFLDRSKLG